jgi:hypothetical protein
MENPSTAPGTREAFPDRKSWSARGCVIVMSDEWTGSTTKLFPGTASILDNVHTRRTHLEYSFVGFNKLVRFPTNMPHGVVKKERMFGPPSTCRKLI